jgi:hypothetical protein
MATPKEDLAALLAVQEVDNKIRQVKEALSALDSGSNLATAYNEGKAAFDRLKATAMKAETEQKDAELQLQTIDAKMVQVNKTLYGGTVTASRELENLQRELDMLERQRGDAEEKVLIAMETVAQSVKQAQKREAFLLAVAAKYKKVRAAYKEQSTTFLEQIKTYEAQRKERVKDVPTPLLEKYDTIRSRRDGVGVVVMLDSGACGGCYTVLSKGLATAIRAGETIEVCEHCGRFLAPAPVAES